MRKPGRDSKRLTDLPEANFPEGVGQWKPEVWVVKGAGGRGWCQ